MRPLNTESRQEYPVRIFSRIFGGGGATPVEIEQDCPCVQTRPEDLILLRRGKGKKLLRISQREKNKREEKMRREEKREKDLKVGHPDITTLYINYM